MNPIFAAALEVQDFCRARHWRFCVIGGVAVQRWGEPHLTALTGFGTEDTFVTALLRGPPDGVTRNRTRPRRAGKRSKGDGGWSGALVDQARAPACQNRHADGLTW